MTRFRRWAVVAALVLLVVCAPLARRLLPVHDDPASATELLARIAASQDQGYSGYVETLGTLQLPVSDRFLDIGTLLGEPTRMRVWWRSADSWRVDRLLATGESDLVHDGPLTTRWDYEDGEARQGIDPAIRLPRASDLLPAPLAHRLLGGAADEEVTRLPAARVAGRDAPGLRLTPASTSTSIDHVDVWADAVSGLPLRVEVYDAAGADPVFTSQFRDFSAGAPGPATTRFEPAPGVRVSTDDVLDIADAANRYAPLVPPKTLAGLPRSPTSDGAVGVYGSGVSQVLALPLRDREAVPLREQLDRTPGVRRGPEGTSVSVGPLGTLLTGGPSQGGWLVTGTVTQRTLREAARDLATGVRFVEGER